MKIPFFPNIFVGFAFYVSSFYKKIIMRQLLWHMIHIKSKIGKCWIAQSFRAYPLLLRGQNTMLGVRDKARVVWYDMRGRSSCGIVQYV